MEQSNDIEKSLVGKFDIHSDTHPLFRSKEETEKLIYEKEPITVEPTYANEQRQLPRQQSLFG